MAFKSDAQRRAVMAQMAAKDNSGKRPGLIQRFKGRISRFRETQKHKQAYRELGKAVMQTKEFKSYYNSGLNAGHKEGEALRNRVQFGTKHLGKNHPKVVAGRAAHKYLYGNK